MTTQNIIGGTSALPQVLVSKAIESSETTQYTGPANQAVRILGATLCNTSGSSVNVSVSLVKSGGSAGTANRLLKTYPLAAGDTTIISELVGQAVGPGDFISTLAATASVVALVISGIVFA